MKKPKDKWKQSIDTKYRDLFENNRDGIYITTVDGKIIEVNQAALEITGHKTQKEFANQNTADHYVDPKERVQFQKEIKSKGYVQDFPVRLRKKDGSIVYCLLTSSALKSNNGSIIGYQGIIRDVTKWKRAEDRLVKSEKKYKRLIKVMNEGMLQVDNNDVIQHVNDRFCEMTEYKRHELIGEVAYDLLLKGADKKKMKKRVKNRPSGIRDHIELNIKCKSGKMISVYIGSSPVYNDNGKVIGSMGILTDITKRKNVERTLKKSEKRFKDLFEGSPDAIFVESLNGIVLDANPAACALHGLEYEELIGIGFIDLIPKEHRAEVETNYKNFIENDLQYIQSYSLNKNRKSIPIEITVNHIEYNGKPAVILHVRDIRERRKTEIKLTKSYQQLRKLAQHLQDVKEQESTRIARDLHDSLGQVLTALKIDISLLHQQLSDPAKLNGNLDSLSDKTKSMLSHLDSTMKSIRRISANLRPVILDDMGLIPAIEWLVEDFRSRTKIKCKLEMDDGIGAGMKSDMETAFFRIVQESFTNIIKHANATKVTVSLYKKNKNLLLEVVDNGVGIDKKQKEKKDISYGLLGMQERALSLSGKFNVFCDRGKGTKVRVKIPILTK